MLVTAHVDLARWYRVYVKPLHADIHIACAYRDKSAQEQAVADGKSGLHYPHSKHNHVSLGVPCSLALDLFEQIKGVYHSRYKTYLAIHENNKAHKLPIRWGGTFTDLKDGPHFELIQLDAV